MTDSPQLDLWQMAGAGIEELLACGVVFGHDDREALRSAETPHAPAASGDLAAAEVRQGLERSWLVQHLCGGKRSANRRIGGIRGDVECDQSRRLR